MKKIIFLLIFSLLTTLTSRAQDGLLYSTDGWLSNSFINEVFLDKDGFLWVATHNGLNRFDGYQAKVILKEDKKFGLNSNYVNCLFQDRKGDLYIGTNRGVQKLVKGKFEDIELKNKKGHPIATFVSDIIQLNNGNIIIGTSGFGLYCYDGKSTKPYAIRGHKQVSARKMLVDKKNRLWIVSENDGLFMINGHQVNHFFSSGDVMNSIQAVAEDAHGGIYIGTRKQGLYYLPANQSGSSLI